MMPIEWLLKELVELMYDRKISHETVEVIYDLIARWKEETNEVAG